MRDLDSTTQLAGRPATERAGENGAEPLAVPAVGTSSGEAASDSALRQAVDAHHELDAPPWRRVESTLMAVASMIRQAYDDRLAALGLNLSQASLLAYVCDFGPVNQSRAAEHLGQGRAVTGTQVDKLESLGLVARHPDPEDRRVWLLTATPHGRALARSVAETDEVLRAHLRRGISRSERQMLAELLNRLQTNLRSQPVTAARDDADRASQVRAAGVRAEAASASTKDQP